MNTVQIERIQVPDTACDDSEHLDGHRTGRAMKVELWEPVEGWPVAKLTYADGTSCDTGICLARNPHMRAWSFTSHWRGEVSIASTDHKDGEDILVCSLDIFGGGA